MSKPVFGFLQDSALSDSDAEDEGLGSVAQQQLFSPAARAALTAYSTALAPNRVKPPGDSNIKSRLEAAGCSNQLCNDAAECSSSNQQQLLRNPQRALESSGKSSRGPRRLSRRKSGVGDVSDSEQQPLQIQGKSGSALTRDPAKDIARAASRGRASGLSLVPLVRPNPGGIGFRVTSFRPVAAPASPAQYSALEPVEFAIDTLPWRRTSSAQSQRQDAFGDWHVSSPIADAADISSAAVAADLPNGFGPPPVVTPILATAQLDADSMEAARAITEYPWHYNFIPAARRAPTGTAGFAASSSLEQDRRRALLSDAQHRKQGTSGTAIPKESMQDEFSSVLPPSTNTSTSARMMMGYSRSLSGVEQQRGLPCLEINGHPVSLSPDRPSSAARVTVG